MIIPYVFLASGAVNRRMSAAGNLPTTRARSSSMDMADQPIGVKNLIFDNTRAYQQRHPDINEEKH